MIEEVSIILGLRASTLTRKCSMRSIKTKAALAGFWPLFRPSS